MPTQCCTRLCAFLLLATVTSIASADTQEFVIHEDANLTQGLSQARSDYLAIKPYMSRVDATILVPNPDGSWSRGSYNPETIAYPASVVKLCYLASAMYWSRINGHPYDHLDYALRPMIADSSNFYTGVTVDAITGAPNYSTNSYNSTFWDWYDKRLFTENYLAGRGLLENQTIIHKTYPTNSGNSPNGAESLASSYRGGNRMQPKATASLMLEMVKGALEPGSTSYMRELLTSDPWGSDSVFGYGVPPGSLYENKLGLAFDTLEDVAYIILPNGQPFILAAYSDGFSGPEPGQPFPWDASGLGSFCEMVIDELDLAVGSPPKIIIDNTDPRVTANGNWTTVTDRNVDYDMYGSSYLSIASTRSGGSSVTWNLQVPNTGRYEVTVWSPQKTTSSNIVYVVNHAGGSSQITRDQRKFGGRWYRLGDFDFNAGQGSIVLNNRASSAGSTIMADAVKITQWPSGVLFDDDADGVVGGTDFLGFTNCNAGPENGPVDGPCENQNANGDDDVDIADFVELQKAY